MCRWITYTSQAAVLSKKAQILVGLMRPSQYRRELHFELLMMSIRACCKVTARYPDPVSARKKCEHTLEKKSWELSALIEYPKDKWQRQYKENRYKQSESIKTQLNLKKNNQSRLHHVEFSKALDFLSFSN